ncbi:hypothetical protein JVT61DRAFT_2792 [Boletus reticuloceps]|uniref:Uncharacterized protein n=1 Tax=Boletus reticuloceps TaxID=495285 RepID=A0A8I2YN47_9AGAM|nr:hypothetical protein JVT61DRAFT_2792 [Boletus reticuloceps]
MKLMAQGKDLVDKEDHGILDRMAQLASRNDFFKITAMKQLLTAIERAVCPFFFSVPNVFLAFGPSPWGALEKQCHGPQYNY